MGGNFLVAGHLKNTTALQLEKLGDHLLIDVRLKGRQVGLCENRLLVQTVLVLRVGRVRPAHVSAEPFQLRRLWRGFLC
jgi:hypothetical protein